MYKSSYSWKWYRFSCSHYLKCIGEAVISFWDLVASDLGVSATQDMFKSFSAKVDKLVLDMKESLFEPPKVPVNE